MNVHVQKDDLKNFKGAARAPPLISKVADIDQDIEDFDF